MLENVEIARLHREGHQESRGLKDSNPTVAQDRSLGRKVDHQRWKWNCVANQRQMRKRETKLNIGR